MEGGVTLRGDDGAFLAEGVTKWENISVCWRRNSKRFALSWALGKEDVKRKVKVWEWRTEESKGNLKVTRKQERNKYFMSLKYLCKYLCT